MNRIFRVVWNASLGVWQVRSELGGSYGKARRTRAARRALAAASLSLAASAACAADLPTGGMVVAGQGNIAQQGNAMTVNQASGKMAIDWNSFSIGKGNTVNFVQPSSTSVALNRVTGSDVSTIQGALKANGQVFLLNPNGVLFSPTAQVNVGGLLASTLNMSNQDFMSGNYKLQGASVNAVINQGNIQAFNGGAVTLVAAHVSNVGEISAERGNVLLGAGSEVLVDLGGPIKLQIQRGAIDALIENGGAVRADGGTVLMTAKAAGDLLTTVINNNGVVQARTLASGEQGQIMLLGDMQNGRIDVAGKLDASAPQGGNGGFIETSAADVSTARSVQIDASAAHGRGGQWLIDPYNYTIDATAAGNIVGALNLGTSVTVTTQSSNSGYGATGSGSGDITVASTISKSAGGDATLTLRADRNIAVNSDITSTVGKLGVTLSAGNAAAATVGGVDVNANLNSNGGNILIGGANGTAVNGIGYALNSSSTTAAVVVERAKSILSQGGNIAINGKSLVGSNNGSYSGTTGGVYIMSDASILSGTGTLFITGVSTAGIKTFGVAFEGSSGTLTTLGNSAGGGMQLNALNTTSGATQANLDQGAIGMVSYGNRARIAFQGNSVASWLVFVNGAPQLSAYTQSPQLSDCATPYPNCGTLVIPGSNNSYLYATYKAVSMATQPIYVIQNAAGTKTYDGNNTATGVTLTSLGGPGGFSVSSLTPAVAYTTSSKNVGNYVSLAADPNNPTSYSSGGTTYAVGYFNTGSYSITAKALTPSAANKVYDGTTAAAVSATGVIAGDSVSLSGTGAFASKDVGTYSVNINNISLSGADAGNYTLSSNNASASASITARSVTISATKTYDGSANLAGYVTIGNLVSGESLTYSGATANSANVGSASYINAITLQNGGNGAASNYALPSLASASASNSAAITPKALTVTGLTAIDKTYDGNRSATLSGGALSGLVGAETLNFSGLSGLFADKNAGVGKSVTVSGITLADGTGLASNYTISNPSGLTASIAKRAASVSGVTASGKTYDGSTSAQINTSNAVISNVIDGDSVSLSATGAFANANAGNAKTVNIASSYGGVDAGNYAIADQASTTATIARKAIALTGVAASDKTYDGNTNAALSGGTLTGLVGSETLNFSGMSGAFADKNAGAGKSVTVSGLTLADGTGLASNYTISNPAGLTASITRRATTVSGITAADKTYDGTTGAQLNTSNAAFSNLVDGDSLSVSATGAFANANAGAGKTVSIASSYSGADAANYTITDQTNATASITRKALTLTGLTANDKTYDGNTSATLSGGNLNGLVGAETLNVTGMSAVFADKNAGAGKTVTVSGPTLTDGSGLASNYSISTPSALTATITPRATTVSGITAADKTYDGTTGAQLNTGNAAFSNLVDGDSLSLTATGAFANANAGAGKAVSITSSYSGADAANYTIADQTNATASIARKALTLTGLAASDKTYDGNTNAALVGGALHGLVGAETLNVSGMSGAFADKNAGTGKAVTVSGLTLSDGSGLASNYTISNPTGLTATIAPRATTVSGITAADKTYDGTTGAQLNTSNAAFSNLVDGDSLSLTATGAFANANAGAGKAVTITSSYSGADAANYTIADQTNATASIARKALTLTGISASDKTYDGNTNATLSGGSLNGLVGTETLNVTGMSAVFADKNAGAGKTVTVSGPTMTDGSGLASNYTITTPSALTATITPRATTVSGITAADKTYDGTTGAQLNTSNAAFSNLVDGDSLSLTATGAFANANAGAGKAVTINSSYSGADVGNYTVTDQANAAASIARKALTLTGLAASDKTYDGNTNAALVGGALHGLVGEETLNVTGMSGAFADKNAATGKAVTVSGVTLSDGTGLASNYTISNPTGLTATITPRATTVSGITAADKTYDGTTGAQLNTSNAAFSNLVEGDSLGVSASGAFINANAGAGKAVNIASNYSGADVANYTITDQGTTTASVARKSLSISGMKASDKVYDATTSATVTGGSLNGLVGSESLVISGVNASFADRNVGSDKPVAVNSIHLADGTGLASNYELIVPTGMQASISPKVLTVSGATAASKVEDGNTIASLTSRGSLAGVAAGDSVHIDSGSGAAQFAQSTPGTEIGVSVTGLTLAGPDARNYSISGSTVASANITAAPAPAPEPAPIVRPVVIPDVAPAASVEPTPVPAPVPVVEVVPAPAPAPVPVVVQEPAPVPVAVPVSVPAPIPVPAPVPAPVVAVEVPAPKPAPVEPVAVPAPAPAPAVVVEAPAPAAPVAVPAPAPVVQPSPAPDTRAAIAAQVASPALQGGVTPAMPSLSVGGLNYTEVSESSAAPASSSNREHMPASQSLTAGRDVKFLSVFVVSGGIQMPAAATTNSNASTNDQK